MQAPIRFWVCSIEALCATFVYYAGGHPLVVRGLDVHALCATLSLLIFVC